MGHSGEVRRLRGVIWKVRRLSGGHLEVLVLVLGLFINNDKTEGRI